ncbi:MAG: tRNA (N6-threonylcarbamoyladenosine(37)-N6)-methyltransferase TrmO [Desulfoplanes sp.]|nr:tRNA (N6-threonylcarbamoyladenosine(37)-N6)-methyltransferase TrmO [Desulfoplanes sp.]
MPDFSFHSIGTIHTPFKNRKGMPIQPAGAKNICGTIEILEKYAAGLKDLGGFSHIILLYAFHKSQGFDLEVTPFMDTVTHGLFSTRAPRRPNPLGMSVVRLLEHKGAKLIIQGIDVLDGTPLLDIKPYVPAFDGPAADALGWLEKNAAKADNLRSDARFTTP